MHPIFGHFHQLEFNKQDLPESIQVDVLVKVIENYNNLTKDSDKSPTELQVFVFINAVICHICSGFQNLQFNYEHDVNGSYVTAVSSWTISLIIRALRYMIYK